VVTAPRVPAAESTRDPTAFATVIDTRSAVAHVETLGDALAESVGVQVRRFGGLGAFSTVSIRGSSAGQVQVYLDGVPLSRADNETVNLSDLPLDTVDHVEVYRGTTPLAFAQAGPGGIVNVVTRRGADPPETGASASYGAFTTRKVDAVRSARVGPWDYLAFAHYLGSAGDFLFTNDLGTTANPADDRTERRVNNDFNLGDVVARLGYRGDGPVSGLFTSDTFVKESGVPGAGSVQATDARLREVRQVAHLDTNIVPLRGAPLDASAAAWVVYDGEAFRDREGEVAFVPQDTVRASTAVGGQTIVRGALGAHQIPGLFLGASHERFAEDDRLDPVPPIPDRTRLRGTVAAEDEIVLFGERVSLLPGVRWEVFRDDFPGTPDVPVALRARGVQVDDFVSPRIGLRAEPWPWVTFLGNLGRYAREPNLSELFGNRGVVIGNPNLRPETAVNRDVGLRLAPPPVWPLGDVHLEYAYFDNTIDDLILLVQNSQNIAHPENVSSARVQGHEVSARARLGAHVGLIANYTHQDARDTGDVTFLHGKRLPGRPADEAFAHVELGWSRANPLPLGGVGQRLWPGRIFYEVNVIAGDFLDRANTREVTSRLLQDVGVEVTLPLARTRVTLEVKNLGDDKTRDVLGFPLPGRAAFVTLTWGLGGDVAPAP
jgi:iron complex outermembrane recepter protein